MIGKSALVVDDSKSARFALRRYLEGHRYQVDTVESADEALRYLEGSKPGVIFLDHVMPGVDGFTVLRTLKGQKETSAIPVVICSSNEGPEFNAQARVAGAAWVLQKPPNPEHLNKILSDIESASSLNAGAQSRSSSVEAPVLKLVTREAPTLPKVIVKDQAPAAASATAAIAGNGDAQVRDQLETRMKNVSQGLFVQFAEIKATVAHLSSQQARLAEAPGNLRSEMRNGLDETHQALRLITSRIEGMEREMFSQLTAMRTHLEASLQANAEHIGNLTETARQAAKEEAQIVAERTVMSAAMRISDQLADAIIGAAGRR